MEPETSTPPNPTLGKREAAPGAGERGAAPDHATATPNPTLGKREGRSPRDMAFSLVILLVPIALLLTFWRVVLSGDAPVTVDPSSAIQSARSSNAFPVLVPDGLGDDWHVSTAAFRPAADQEGSTLRIGYVAPDDDAALLVQSNAPQDTLLPAELGDQAEATETFRAPNGVWRQYRARGGEIGLVLTSNERTVIVVGTADEKHLEALAASLR